MSLCLNQFQSGILASKGSNIYIFEQRYWFYNSSYQPRGSTTLCSDFFVLKEYIKTIHPLVTYRIFVFSEYKNIHQRHQRNPTTTNNKNVLNFILKCVFYKIGMNHLTVCVDSQFLHQSLDDGRLLQVRGNQQLCWGSLRAQWQRTRLTVQEKWA